MRHLFIIDPIDRLQLEADTTIAFMREAAARGHGVAVCEAAELRLGPGGSPRARTTAVELTDGANWYHATTTADSALGEFDAVWMRKDPPFDLNYLFATHILSLAPPPTLVVNDPQALRDYNEKLFALHFPEVCPETIVSRQLAELLAFHERLGGEMVVKPLDGAGGEGVFHITPGDHNTRAILEMGTRHEQQYLMAQRYIPEIRQGDKRVILIEGEPAGAVLRVPVAGEARANFHAGGSAARMRLSERDLEICAAVGPTLRERGVVFAGIDIIGEWLTEINVTSPTGIREIARLDGVLLEQPVLDAVEARFARRRNAASKAAR